MQKRFVWKSRRGQAPSFCEQRKLVNIHAFLLYFQPPFSGVAEARGQWALHIFSEKKEYMRKEKEIVY